MAPFTTADGTGVDWGRLARVSFAFVVTTVFTNIAALVTGAFGFVQTGLRRIARFFGDIVGRLFGPVPQISASLERLANAVGGADVLGFAAALALVAVLAYVVAWGRDLL